MKQKDTVGRPDIDAFEKAMRRSKRGKGFFVSFDYTEDALQVIDRFVTVHLTSVRGRGGDEPSPPLPRALGRPEQLQRFFKADHAIIIPLTVKEILDWPIARKLAQNREAEAQWQLHDC